MATFTGTAGNDIANATNGTLIGFTGGTVTELQDGTGDVFAGLAGNDAVTAGAGADTIDGGDGADVLNGADGDDSLFGGADSDTLVGGAGNDVLDGGVQAITERIADVLDYSSDTLGVFVDIPNGTASGASIGTDTVTNFEVVVGGSGDDTLIAAGGGGGMGLMGSAGNDTLIGVGDGNGLGVAGDLTSARYTNDTAGIVVDLSTGTASGTQIGNDSLIGIRAVAAGSGNDIIIGDQHLNIFTGGAGDDVLNGAGGDDALQGLAGNDTLIGGTGSDGANYAQDTQGITASLITGIATGPGVGTDRLISIENFNTASGNDNLTGDNNANRFITRGGADLIDARGGTDTISTGADADTIDGGGGQDTIDGGAGDDVMDGGNGDDLFLFIGDFGADAIDNLDAKPGGGQDLLDISALGVSDADFATLVTIDDLGSDTLITIASTTATAGGTILLLGVNGNGQNAITQNDFVLA